MSTPPATPPGPPPSGPPHRPAAAEAKPDAPDVMPGAPDSCGPDGTWSQTWTLTATGTTWRVLTHEPLPRRLRAQVLALTEAYEDVFSRFRPGSLVSRAAAGITGGAAPGAVTASGARAGEGTTDSGPLSLDLPAGSGRMLELYDRLHAATDGRLDPLVGSDLSDLGYDERCTFVVRDGAAERLGAVGGRAVWGRDARHEGDRLILARPALVDVGAVGKGFLVDLLGRALEAGGVEQYIVDGSGDLLVRSELPVRLGMEEPRPAGARCGAGSRVVGVVTLTRGALCASGTHLRTWGAGLHHILDAVTGLPVAGAGRVVASWAVAADAATADGAATALFLTDPARLAAAGLVFDFALLRADGSAAVSRGFAQLPGELFTA